MKVIDFHQGPDKDLILRCDCCEDHFLVFNYWKLFEDRDEVYLRVVDEWRTPKGLWGRIRAAAGLFVKGEHCRGEIQVSIASLLAIQEWCGQFIPVTESR